MTTIHTRRRPTVAIGAVSLALALLTACGSGDAETSAAAAADATDGAYPVTVEDCSGEVTFDARPEKVMTIGTAAISLLDAAGASQLVTARSGEFDAPLPTGLTTPPSDASIVDPADPTAEAIIGAGVDVVYGYGLFNAKPEVLEQAGVPVLTAQGECGHDSTGTTRPITFSTVTDDIRRLGTVFDTSDVADAKADAIDQQVADLTAKAAGNGRSAAWLYYFSSTDALSAYGSSSMAHAILDAATLDDVYGDEPTSYLDITVESLLKDDPDWIVLAYGLYGESQDDAREKFLAEPGVEDLSAVKAGRIVLVPGTSSESSPQALRGLQAVVAATSDAG